MHRRALAHTRTRTHTGTQPRPNPCQRLSFIVSAPSQPVLAVSSRSILYSHDAAAFTIYPLPYHLINQCTARCGHNTIRHTGVGRVRYTTPLRGVSNRTYIGRHSCAGSFTRTHTLAAALHCVSSFGSHCRRQCAELNHMGLRVRATPHYYTVQWHHHPSGSVLQDSAVVQPSLSCIAT